MLYRVIVDYTDQSGVAWPARKVLYVGEDRADAQAAYEKTKVKDYSGQVYEERKTPAKACLGWAIEYLSVSRSRRYSVAARN